MFITLTLLPLQGFSSGETDFHFCQFLSNFFRYSSLNLPSFYLNNIFIVYFPNNSLFLNSFAFGFNFTFHTLFSSSYHLISTFILSSNLSTNYFVFSKSFSFSYVSFSVVNLFQYTKYFITPPTFLLFSIFSIFHSSTLFTFTGFSFSILHLFTGFLYFTILLMFTTEWILIEANSFNYIL